jgi:hypothetical protein
VPPPPPGLWHSCAAAVVDPGLRHHRRRLQAHISDCPMRNAKCKWTQQPARACMRITLHSSHVSMYHLRDRAWQDVLTHALWHAKVCMRILAPDALRMPLLRSGRLSAALTGTAARLQRR